MKLHLADSTGRDKHIDVQRGKYTRSQRKYVVLKNKDGKITREENPTYI